MRDTGAVRGGTRPPPGGGGGAAAGAARNTMWIITASSTSELHLVQLQDLAQTLLGGRHALFRLRPWGEITQSANGI